MIYHMKKVFLLFILKDCTGNVLLCILNRKSHDVVCVVINASICWYLFCCVTLHVYFTVLCI